MVTLSLDTNVLVDILNERNEAVREAFADARRDGQPLAVSAVAVEELIFGARASLRPAVHENAARRLLASLTTTPFDEADAEATAGIRTTLRRSGLTIGYADFLIAGQALARGWTVVTHNRRDFDRVPGLSVIDWR